MNLVFLVLNLLIIHLIHFTKSKNFNIFRSNDVGKWSVDEVVQWMDQLSLSQSYSSIIKSNNVNGIVLKTMKTKDDWKELGINLFGDLRILVTSVERF